jgi:hypothetical protein
MRLLRELFPALVAGAEGRGERHHSPRRAQTSRRTAHTPAAPRRSSLACLFSRSHQRPLVFPEGPATRSTVSTADASLYSAVTRCSGICHEWNAVFPGSKRAHGAYHVQGALEALPGGAGWGWTPAYLREARTSTISLLRENRGASRFFRLLPKRSACRSHDAQARRVLHRVVIKGSEPFGPALLRRQ